MTEVRRARCGFKSRNQLPLFMIWEEFWYGGEIVNGRVLFNSMRWIGI